MKERLMNVKFKERFEVELQKLAKGTTLKSGINTQKKVRQKLVALKKNIHPLLRILRILAR
jgi:hypothetical protein